MGGLLCGGGEEEGDVWKKSGGGAACLKRLCVGILGRLGWRGAASDPLVFHKTE